MGVYIEAKAFYGIVFSYSELKHLITEDDWKELAKEIGTDNLVNLWSEWGFHYCRPYFDADQEHVKYIIGVDISNYSMSKLKELDQERIKNEIKHECTDLELLDYKEPEFIVLADVS